MSGVNLAFSKVLSSRTYSGMWRFRCFLGSKTGSGAVPAIRSKMYMCNRYNSIILEVPYHCGFQFLHGLEQSCPYLVVVARGHSWRFGSCSAHRGGAWMDCLQSPSSGTRSNFLQVSLCWHSVIVQIFHIFIIFYAFFGQFLVISQRQSTETGPNLFKSFL